MKPGMRVVFYEPYPMGLGGNFLTQRLILERLDRRTFTPIVVSPIEGIALVEFRKMGVECVVIPPPGNLDSYGGVVLRYGMLGKLKIVYNLVRYNLKLARFLHNRKISVVYANCVRAQMCIGFAARFTGIPSLLYIKGEQKNPIIDFISFLLANRILFMCRSNMLLTYPRMLKRFKSKISVLEGGLNPCELNMASKKDNSALRRELDIKSCNFNVCVVGQICPMKGQHIVIRALCRIAKEFHNIRVYFVGDSIISEYEPYLNDLIKLVEQDKLVDFVRFVGWRNDALEIIACMNLLINPSFTEGFGYVPLEGMALGLPVIATKVGVLPEAIVDGINGFLVDPDDEVKIYERWRELMINCELREKIGYNARNTIYAKYLLDDKVNLLSEIWADMSKKYPNQCTNI